MTPLVTYTSDLNPCSETVTGTATIRAYRAEDRFIEESQRRVDHNQVSGGSALSALPLFS